MPIPKFLINNYKNWRLSNYNNSKSLYDKAATSKQKPKAIFISCCDSRVNPENIFQSQIGDFFIHRNIANIVPPFNKENDTTASALEYAIKALNVPHVIVLGHSCCGGIEYGYQMHIKNKVNKNLKSVNKWINQIGSIFNNSKNLKDTNDIHYFEKENIKNSINNLLTYPYILNLKKNNKIQIHGIWYELKSGKIMYLNYKSNKFEQIDHL